MTTRMLHCILGAALVATLAGCMDTVPFTGRRQLNLVGSSALSSMSAEQYGAFLQEHPLSNDAAATAMVKRTGGRIARAVEQYFTEQGESDRLKNFDWQFNLVQSDEVNAWCMPGGRVVFYEGILPVCKDETGVAVVMGHEIAHAVANHGGERMSQQLIAQLGAAALDAALQDKPQKTRRIFMGVYGAGAQLGVLLPYSRTHEYEADRLGLMFMAMAGYDPRRAPDFWKDMQAKSKGAAKPPSFLSTHPSDATRIAQLEKRLPKALEHYSDR